MGGCIELHATHACILQSLLRKHPDAFFANSHAFLLAFQTRALTGKSKTCKVKDVQKRAGLRAHSLFREDDAFGKREFNCFRRLLFPNRPASQGLAGAKGARRQGHPGCSSRCPGEGAQPFFAADCENTHMGVMRFTIKTQRCLHTNGLCLTQSRRGKQTHRTVGMTCA